MRRQAEGIILLHLGHGCGISFKPMTKTRKHIKWLTLVGLLAMLIAIAMYVLTLDDSQPVPAPKTEKSDR